MEHDSEKLVLNNDIKKTDYKEQMDQLINKLNNPFVDMYHWCKGEIYDL